MKQGRSLVEMLQELERQNATKRDFILPANRMQMMGALENGQFQMSLVGDSATELFNTEQLFHRQLGTALKIPAPYYELMRREQPELLVNNVNTWLDGRETRHTVRTLDGNARAFLSDRYRRIDNLEVATATLPLLSDMGQLFVESCEVTPDRLYIKVVNERLTTDILPGDTVQAGIMIQNSEVGLGSVKVTPLLYRLVCSNGMVINDMGKRKRHIGRESEESWELFRDETLVQDDKAFLMKLQDIVRSAVEETPFQMVVDRLRDSTQAKITGRVQDVVELAGKASGLIESERDMVLNNLIRDESKHMNLYGLANALTRTAQQVESYDRSTELEAIGWDWATMPKAQWESINKEAEAVA